MRLKVSHQATMSVMCMDLLRDSQIKEELFEFLTSKVAEYPWPEAKAAYIPSGATLKSKGNYSLTSMSNYNHYEADTRIVIHALYDLANCPI